MPEYDVRFTRAAREGLAALDNSERKQVLKQIEKLKHAPELGPPLGTKLGTALAGYRKLYACKKRVRIIYEIQGLKLVVVVIAIGAREDARMRRIVKRPPHGGRVLGLVGTGGHVAATIDHSRIRGSEPHITGSSEAASD